MTETNELSGASETATEHLIDYSLTMMEFGRAKVTEKSAVTGSFMSFVLVIIVAGSVILLFLLTGLALLIGSLVKDYGLGLFSIAVLVFVILIYILLGTRTILLPWLRNRITVMFTGKFHSNN